MIAALIRSIFEQPDRDATHWDQFAVVVDRLTEPGFVDQATFLLDAAEVEQIRVGAQGQRAVGVGREHVVGVDHRERVRKHEPAKAVAVGCEQLRIDFRVAHRSAIFVTGHDSNPKPQPRVIVSN